MKYVLTFLFCSVYIAKVAVERLFLSRSILKFLTKMKPVSFLTKIALPQTLVHANKYDSVSFDHSCEHNVQKQH